jgi:hypothetical protein
VRLAWGSQLTDRRHSAAYQKVHERPLKRESQRSRVQRWPYDGRRSNTRRLAMKNCARGNPSLAHRDRRATGNAGESAISP